MGDTDRWVCPDCEDEWRGDEPPQNCPVDGTARGDFIPADEYSKPDPWEVEETDDSVPNPFKEQSNDTAIDHDGGGA